MIKGVIFDFNGTLFYDSDKHIRAFQMFFEDRGLPVPSAEFIAERTFGKTNKVIFRDIYKADATEEELVLWGEEKEEAYRRACFASPSDMHLASGVCEMLDYLAERGIPFAVATGSDRRNVDFYFENLGIGKWFDIERIVYNDGTLPGKPEPDFYIEAAKRIGLEASECIIFDDGISGLISANAAGAGAVFAVLSLDGDNSADYADVRVDGEICDFAGYREIFARYGI